MYLANNYAPLPLTVVVADGTTIWDADGKSYLDFHSSYSATGLGHGNYQLLQALSNQAQILSVTSRAVNTLPAEDLAEKLAKMTNLDKMLPGSGGAESVETAIKAMRKWGYEVKGIPPNKAKIVTAKNNFHGRTITITSFSTESENKKNFGPFTPGFVSFEFGNLKDLEKKLKAGNVAGVLIEPIQGEAGIIPPPIGFLEGVRDLCDKYNCMMVLDEIQSGLGRTGKLFAYMHSDIQPDGVIVGKALGGGLLPVSAFVASDELMNVFTPGVHGSTFGGNPLACAVALEVLKMIDNQEMADNISELSNYLKIHLEDVLQHRIVKDVRHIGLWAGVELKKKYNAHDVAIKALDEGLFIKDTRNSLRLAPPLTVTLNELELGMNKLMRTLDSM